MLGCLQHTFDTVANPDLPSLLVFKQSKSLGLLLSRNCGHHHVIFGFSVVVTAFGKWRLQPMPALCRGNLQHLKTIAGGWRYLKQALVASKG